MVPATWAANSWYRRHADRVLGYACLVPVLAVLGFVVAWPLYEAVRMSLHEIYLLKDFTNETFIGLGNYARFFGDPQASTYFLNTAIYVVGGTAGQLAVAMLLAVLLNRRVVLRGFWRGLAIVPWAMPMTVTALIWRWIFNGQWGILNYVLVTLGVVGEYVAWLSSRVFMWPAILVVDVWAGFPFMFVNLLSGMQSIPHEVHEAARLDGASAWSIFWRITLPMLQPIIAAVVLLGVILHLREFAAIWILTSGGPGIRSTTLSPLVYITSFRYFRMGYGAAIGVVLMAASLLFTVLYLRRVRMES